MLVQRAKRGELALVVAAVAAGVDDDLLVGFGVLELDHPVVGERHFGFVENVKQDHIVAAMPQPAECLKDRSGVAKQIGEDHHQAVVPQHGGNLRQALGDVGRPGRLELGQVGENVAELGAFALGGETVADVLCRT